MQLFTDPNEASKSVERQFFLPRICPFTAPSDSDRVCGDWCPHFHIIKGSGNTISAVSLSCGGQECIIKIR